MGRRLGYRFLVFGFVLVFCVSDRRSLRTRADDDPNTIARAQQYLTETSRNLLEGCRVRAQNGTTLYVPDGKGHYQALWTRDFAYMVENAGDLIPAEHVEACIRYLLRGQRADGAIPDRVRPDGVPVYSAGPENRPLGKANLDNGPFLVIAVDEFLKRCPSDRQRALFREWAEPLTKGISFVPRSGSGLVYNDPQEPHSPYGFTDCIAKTGELFIESVLYWTACQRLAHRYRQAGAGHDKLVSEFLDRARLIEANIGVLWDEKAGAFLAATHDCRQLDVWGNAYAVYVGFPLAEKRERILRFLIDNYDRYVWRGQVRHLLKGEYWQRLLSPVERDRYQNGAYWATASGWVYWAIAQKEPALARRMLADLVADFRGNGVCECVGEGYRQLESYVASATNALGAVRRLEAGKKSVVWPEKDWPIAAPESQGMSSAALQVAAEYALRHGGGSGCVIHHGYLVKEWGPMERRADIKSCTKGTLGATILGLAVDDGLVRLDEFARSHYPQIGTERAENQRTGWLGRITLRHLATMTAGFDDGRPPLLVYEPGTKGIYSNDTSNMLAELLTLRFRQDLRTVVQKRVFEPIGVPADSWRWRDNSFRAKTVNGLASREFASGLTITHRAIARIGYLYLREGRWRDRQIISREYLRQATQPTELPSFVPYYAFYWASNARGTLPEIPNDCYWALGLGDSFLLVCPSLDIVAVRLGVGSKESQLPGGDGPADWGKRVAGFFRLVVAAVQPRGNSGANDGKTSAKGNDAADRAPYPPSPAIRSIAWDPVASIRRQAKGSDNWPLTWADDDCLYTGYGDGNGFDPRVPEKLSLGFARVAGGPEDFVGLNVRSATGESKGDDKKGRKASGILMVDGVLYLWVRNVGNSQLAWSADRARTWTWCDWKFTESFGCPTFLNFGKNYAGARDDFVYLYSHDADSAYTAADRMVLARVSKRQISERTAYEFFRELGRDGHPIWTNDIRQRGAVFVHTGKCYRSGISFNPGLRRYLWCQTLPGRDARFGGGFGIFDAPEPWGPWTTVYFTTEWDTGPGETSSLPTKWMSDDGTTVHLAFSGEDSFSVRRGVFERRER